MAGQANDNAIGISQAGRLADVTGAGNVVTCDGTMVTGAWWIGAEVRCWKLTWRRAAPAARRRDWLLAAETPAAANGVLPSEPSHPLTT